MANTKESVIVGTCTVLISAVHGLDEFEEGNVASLPDDSDCWWSIIDYAQLVNEACVRLRSSGGRQFAGKKRLEI